MKEKIALLTDSACDIPQELLNKFNIHILPLKVIYKDKEYSDRVDIQPEDVYSRMPNEIPTTSMPSFTEIKNIMENIKAKGFTHLLSMHLSSALSGTHQAVEMVAKEFKDLKIKVIDTRTLSFGTGWLVLEAAKKNLNGFSFDQIIEDISNIRSKIKVYYVLETLEYLRKGGRIGQVAGMVGEFLHLKPIISVDQEGKYFTFCKVRGRKKSIEKLLKIVEDAAKNNPVYLAVMHGGAKAEADKMIAHLKSLPNVIELISSDISPSLGVHTGPGLLGVSFYEA